MEIEEEKYSEGMSDLMSEIPNWIIRWGITVILFFLISILFLSWFIKYPDLIEAKGVFSTVTSPVKLVSKSSGKIKNLFVHDNQNISSGDLIAEIESLVTIEKIKFLDSVVNELEKSYQNINERYVFMDQTLGGIQDEYNNLVKSLNNYFELKKENNHYTKTILNLKYLIQNQESLLIINRKQVFLFKNELKNSKERFGTYKNLYDKGVISKIEMLKENELLTGKENNLEVIKKQLIQTEINLLDNKKRLSDFEYQNSELLRKERENIQSQLLKIRNFINNWKNIYILKSPIDGVLSYSINLKENQFVNINSQLFTVIPVNSQYVVFLNVPTVKFGEVIIGQKVRIRLDNYPYEDYGFLTGEITSISLIPSNGFYRVEATVKDLNTSFNKKIKYTPEMVGLAEIITKDLRLFERLTKKIKKILD